MTFLQPLHLTEVSEIDDETVCTSSCSFFCRCSVLSLRPRVFFNNSPFCVDILGFLICDDEHELEFVDSTLSARLDL